ncbi:uncharacterized protein L3040_007827 [Drepanopeziza brunnea f. sp. 'multigermtubi']|uniref:Insulin-induced protein n=1 Tax=Marssonina brunnea f. sp. multigermtubi (strain MB_m1) TaxID=1072389 RepID=K1XKZ2_MARBU|nr:insulin-induced protein [Drepanopeziza brunnea f. sp. 'multigermtubi' MB_m1]EKD13104.1 insulin-induced protein [Drepanopeziza brunnea f. sp. 'multigermtubi' MB_m1]KAJ5035353.1 hypothetical protein L3040_007827 [Drepanopeziza brunnea f. sp. 'multigermtubi']
MASQFSHPPIQRPKPRRPFDAIRAAEPPSPQLQASGSPSRNQSFLNLTSSTLLGIYSPTGYNGEAGSEVVTPWGTGAQTPRTPGLSSASLFSLPSNLNTDGKEAESASGSVQWHRRKSQPHIPPPRKSAMVFALALRSVLLFSIGMGYGSLVRHLHDDHQLAPFQVEGIIKLQNDWRYLVFWGFAGVGLGSLMPWVDTLFLAPASEERVDLGRKGMGTEVEHEEREGGVFGADWTPVVRSVGAFVGIAYAIRKLPWSSPLQASLTLFLVNPVLWYLLDRSYSGFILSSFVGLFGTTALLVSNPGMVPSPATTVLPGTTKPFGIPALNATHQAGGVYLEGVLGGPGLSRETLEAGIWTLSVLFCSCVCFGNVGRRLALRGGGGVVGRRN